MTHCRNNANDFWLGFQNTTFPTVPVFIGFTTYHFQWYYSLKVNTFQDTVIMQVNLLFCFPDFPGKIWWGIILSPSNSRVEKGIQEFQTKKHVAFFSRDLHIIKKNKQKGWIDTNWPSKCRPWCNSKKVPNICIMLYRWFVEWVHCVISHIVYATTLGFWLPWSILKGPKEDGEDDRLESHHPITYIYHPPN